MDEICNSLNLQRDRNSLTPYAFKKSPGPCETFSKFTKKVAPKSHFTIKVVPKSQFYEMEKSIMNKNYN